MRLELFRIVLAGAGAMLLWTAAAQAQGQGQGSSSYLPAENAVREAVAQSPDVLAAEARRDAVLARAEGIRVGTAETVVRAIGQGRQVRDPSERHAEGQIALERPLRLWGKAQADGQLADAAAEAGQFAVKDARHEASRQILALWFAAVRAGQVRQAAQENAKAATDLATLTARRVQLGDASRLEAELAAADRARMQAALATAEATERTAQAELQARFPGLGHPALSADTALAALPPDPHDPPDRLRTQYIQDSHEYRLAMAEEAQAQQMAKRADLDRRPDPTVGMFVTVERGGAERIMGVSVAMPIGSAHRRSAAVAAAADAETAARRRLGAERRLAAEFDVLYGNLQGKRASARAQMEAATLQKSASDRATRAYRAGESGLTELLAARRNLAEAQLAERLARVDLLEADSRLQLDLHRMWDFDD
ncbi:metal transporter [Ralstonia solanacearum]|uniref:TolC family protein n=1 Tax=Ralstonia pseudosolanacearum TaxID=1310165 RepID=UPI000C9FE026|nr:TolC family protein [Ralstonia pseudosolanacearum]AUS41609.1 metal transporter [Ralstonia solanacearum]